MTEQEGPTSGDVPSAEDSPPAQDAAATAEVPAAEAPAPEIPSETPVDGWVRGVDGKWWPPAPTRERPRPTVPSTRARSKRGRRLVGGVGFVIFVIVVLAIVGGIVAVLVNYGDDSDASNTTKGAHAIGETARTASVDATVTGAQNPYVEPNPGPQPPAGSHFVAIQLAMTNVSTKDLVVAPEQVFQLVDASGQKEQLIVSTSVPRMEGVLVALGTRQGGVVFIVPDTARAPLTFRVKGEPGAGGVTYAIP